MEPFEFEGAYRTSKDKIVGYIVLGLLFLLYVIAFGGLIIYGLYNFDFFTNMIIPIIWVSIVVLIAFSIRRKKFSKAYDYYSFIGNYTKSNCVLDQHGLHLIGKHGMIDIPVEDINEFEDITEQGQYETEPRVVGLNLNTSKYQLLINTPVQENDDFMSAFYKKLDEIADVTDKAMNVER